MRDTTARAAASARRESGRTTRERGDKKCAARSRGRRSSARTWRRRWRRRERRETKRCGRSRDEGETREGASALGRTRGGEERGRTRGGASSRDAFESRRRREEEKRFDPRARARRAASGGEAKTSGRDDDDDDDDDDDCHCGASTLDEYEAAWCAFERRAMSGARIAFDDVPWPRSGAWLLRQSLANAGDDRDATKRANRAFFVRWHPDKFTQRFGRALVERDRDRIIARASATFRSALAAR